MPRKTLLSGSIVKRETQETIRSDPCIPPIARRSSIINAANCQAGHVSAFEREYRHLTLQHFKWTTVAWPRKCRVERRKLGVGKNDIGGRAVLPHMCD